MLLIGLPLDSFILKAFTGTYALAGHKKVSYLPATCYLRLTAGHIAETTTRQILKNGRDLADRALTPQKAVRLMGQ